MSVTPFYNHCIVCQIMTLKEWHVTVKQQGYRNTTPQQTTPARQNQRIKHDNPNQVLRKETRKMLPVLMSYKKKSPPSPPVILMVILHLIEVNQTTEKHHAVQQCVLYHGTGEVGANSVAITMAMCYFSSFFRFYCMLFVFFFFFHLLFGF